MCVCVYLYIHSYLSMYTHTHIYIVIFNVAHLLSCTCLAIGAAVLRESAHISIYVSRMCIYMCIYIYIYMCVCVCVYLYIYSYLSMYTHTHIYIVIFNVAHLLSCTCLAIGAAVLRESAQRGGDRLARVQERDQQSRERIYVCGLLFLTREKKTNIMYNCNYSSKTNHRG